MGSSGSGSSDSLDASWSLVAADDIDSRPELLLRQRLFSDGKSEKLAMSLMSSRPRSDEKWLVTPLSKVLAVEAAAVLAMVSLLKGLIMPLPSLVVMELD